MLVLQSSGVEHDNTLSEGGFVLPGFKKITGQHNIITMKNNKHY